MLTVAVDTSKNRVTKRHKRELLDLSVHRVRINFVDNFLVAWPCTDVCGPSLQQQLLFVPYLIVEPHRPGIISLQYDETDKYISFAGRNTMSTMQ
mmetsp:Transcript_56411/g.136890  ORF Transcript_56411/g.136890 Transcript_56411/m.136890 type:complete len:95 (-) Transcript_56411:1283-1567(-)